VKARKPLIALIVLVAFLAAGFAAMIVFGGPTPPPPLDSVNQAFAAADRTDAPPVTTWTPRQGTALAYRVYPGGAENVVVLIHGSSGDSLSMHLLARTLRSAGAYVYSLDVRGHGASGTRGDIDHVGQLEEDLVDFLAVHRPRHPGARFDLVGFSSGGGFVLNFAGGPHGEGFDRYTLVSPAIPRSPVFRENGGWVSVGIPRLIALGILDRLHLRSLGGLPVVAFAVAPGSTIQVPAYSYRLAEDFGIGADYNERIRRTPRPLRVLIGADDELLYANQIGPLFHAVRPQIPVTVVRGLGHMGMIVAPSGLEAIRESILPSR